MTRYQQLSSAWWSTRSQDFAYRDSYAQFAVSTIAAIQKALEAPADRFQVIPLEDDPEPRTQYSEYGAGEFAEDNWFHIRFQIILQLDDHTFPRMALRVRLAIKKDSDGWHIRIHPAGRDIRVGLKEPPTAFARSFLDDLHVYLAYTLQQSIETPSQRRGIGFELVPEAEGDREEQGDQDEDDE